MLFLLLLFERLWGTRVGPFMSIFAILGFLCLFCWCVKSFWEHQTRKAAGAELHSFAVSYIYCLKVNTCTWINSRAIALDWLKAQNCHLVWARVKCECPVRDWWPAWSDSRGKQQEIDVLLFQAVAFAHRRISSLSPTFTWINRPFSSISPKKSTRILSCSVDANELIY